MLFKNWLLTGRESEMNTCVWQWEFTTIVMPCCENLTYVKLQPCFHFTYCMCFSFFPLPTQSKDTFLQSNAPWLELQPLKLKLWVSFLFAKPICESEGERTYKSKANCNLAWRACPAVVLSQNQLYLSCYSEPLSFIGYSSFFRYWEIWVIMTNLQGQNYYLHLTDEELRLSNTH